MDCSWIKIYDTPEKETELSPDALYAGDTIYVDISGLYEDYPEYEFVVWKDLQGNILGEDVIKSVGDGLYQTTVSCGGEFVAYVKAKKGETCLVKVECDETQGSVKIEGEPDQCGGEVVISAEPKCCYEFEKWDDDDTISSRRVIVKEGTETYTAIFKEKQVNITVSANDDEMGNVSVTPDTVKCGETFTITAIAYSDYNFQKWEWMDAEGNIQDSNDKEIVFTHECDGPTNFTAYFYSAECKVIIEATDERAVLKQGDIKIQWNEEISISDDTILDVVPPEGCCFVGWFDMDDGLFLNPCDDAETTEYRYITIPSACIDKVKDDKVSEVSDEDFIQIIGNSELKDTIIIKNKKTGEYRQAIPICTGEESYNFTCGHTVMAVITCNIFTELADVPKEWPQSSYKGIFKTFYDFVNNFKDEGYNPYLLVYIGEGDVEPQDEEKTWYEYKKCNTNDEKTK